MDVYALSELIRAERATLLPFVGSGMTIAAGAPSVTSLARALAARTGVAAPGPWPELDDVTRAAEARCTVHGVREHLVEIVT